MNQTNRRTSPHSRDYVRHVPRWASEKTLCGLVSAKVHCVGSKKETSQAECLRCQIILGMRGGR